MALLYLGTLVGAFVAEFVQTTTLQMLGQRIMYDMRRQVYDHLQRLDLAYYDRNPVGRLMTRVTSDVDAINDLFTSGVVSVFGDVLSLLGIIVVLVSLDWRLALLTFCVLPLILMVTQWFRRNVRESYREVRTWVSRLNAFLQENLTGMCDGAAVPARGARRSPSSTASTASTATRTCGRSTTTRCSIPRSS